MKKYIILLGILLGGLFLGGFSSESFAAEVNSISELESAVNEAESNATITLGEEFPLTIDRQISLKETAFQIIIDGEGKTLETKATGNPDSGVTMFSYGGGSGNADSTLTLENITLKGHGQSDTSKAIHAKGYHGNFILDNVIVDNFNGGDNGGAMLAGSNTIIRNSTFSNNTSYAAKAGYSGGAIGNHFFDSKMVITNSRFIGNSTPYTNGGGVGGQGGVMHFNYPGENADFEIKDNYFANNSAAKDTTSNLADGGVFSFWNIKQGVTINIEGNTFEGNIAGDDGGAMLIQAGEKISSGVTLKNNTFYKNQALGGDGGDTNSGGAIQVYGTNENAAISVDYINNTFVNNTAIYGGGAIGNGGEIVDGKEGKDVTGNFYNNLFAGNTADTNPSMNNIAGDFISAKSDSNIGLDNNVTMKDVFGFDTINISENYGTIQAGATVADETASIIPTLPIAPEKAADDQISTYINNIDLNQDQRGKPRPSEADFTAGLKADAGSVEMNWIKYDANGGTFALGSELTDYDGKIFYEGTNPTAYYQVGYDQLATSILNGEADLSATSSQESQKFLGWSENKEATEPDAGLEAGTSVTIKKGNQTLYAIYGNTAGADVTVRYIEVDSSGKNLGNLNPQQTLTGNIDEPFEAEYIKIPGYGLVEIKDGNGNSISKLTGVYTDQPQSIIFEYQKIPTKTGVVIVRYKDEAGKTIDDTDIYTGDVGSSYSSKVKAKTIPGYKLKTTPQNATGNFAEEVTEVTFVYEKDGSSESKLGSVTYLYQDEAGNTLADPITLAGNVGDIYPGENDNVFKTIPNYYLKAIRGSMTGSFIAGNKIVTLIYTQQPTNQGLLVVRYQDEDGHDIAAPEISLGEIGLAYQTNAKKIDNYTFKEVKGNVKGKYAEATTTVTYVYSANNASPAATNNQNTTSPGGTLPQTGNNATTKNLPQTGESKRMATILTILGVIVLAGVAFIVYRRREQTK